MHRVKGRCDAMPHDIGKHEAVGVSIRRRNRKVIAPDHVVGNVERCKGNTRVLRQILFQRQNLDVPGPLQIGECLWSVREGFDTTDDFPT